MAPIHSCILIQNTSPVQLNTNSKLPTPDHSSVSILHEQEVKNYSPKRPVVNEKKVPITNRMFLFKIYKLLVFNTHVQVYKMVHDDILYSDIN